MEEEEAGSRPPTSKSRQRGRRLQAELMASQMKARARERTNERVQSSGCCSPSREELTLRLVLRPRAHYARRGSALSGGALLILNLLFINSEQVLLLGNESGAQGARGEEERREGGAHRD